MMSFSRFTKAWQKRRQTALQEDYVLNPEIAAAVDIALGLGRPLLVTGDPGVGKTELGRAVADILDLPPPRVFVTRSTSEARDVFYRYDALARFRDAQVDRQEATPPPIGKYLMLEALGQAILDANAREIWQPLRRDGTIGWSPPESPRQAVVIIDEIDKAPREVANDMLVEIETYRFRIPEAQIQDAAGNRGIFESGEVPNSLRPLVIFTSNSERQLPEAFLRRCVFLEITFPKKPEDLVRILQAAIRRSFRDGDPPDGQIDTMAKLVRLVQDLRGIDALSRKPSIAETIDALKVLTAPEGPPDRWQHLKYVLAKQVQDRNLIAPHLARVQ